MLVVPGLAFDAALGRLGRGGGYYDVYLDKSQAYKLGVCFDAQMVDHVPMEEHDQRMDEVLCYRHE